MWRRTEPKRPQQMAKLRLPSFRADPKGFEHFVLQLRLVDSHAAAADLDAVQNDVVRLGANIREFLRFKEQHVLRFRSRKGMMHGVPFVFLRAPFKERKVCDPKKIPVQAGWAISNQILQFGHT